MLSIKTCTEVRQFLFILILVITNKVFAQTTISGKVLDVIGIPMAVAIIYSLGSYDASISSFFKSFLQSSVQDIKQSMEANCVGFIKIIKLY